jgi:signal transduction histidine kinase
MLPRLVSYLLADDSKLWGSLSASINMRSMRHEQQLFFGLIPLVLFFYGLYLSFKDRKNLILKSIAITLLALFFLSLSIKDLGAWMYLSNLPLFSAIRAVSRISLVMLFFVSYLAVVAVDKMTRHSSAIIYVVLALLIMEFSLVKVNASPISEWRSRMDLYQRKIPPELPSDAVLIFAQSGHQFNVVEEIDAMWIALVNGSAVMNGYSGYSPPAYGGDYGDKCANIEERIDSYLTAIRPADPIGVRESLVRRMAPIEFGDCKLRLKSEK